jgi:hypothetical protein
MSPIAAGTSFARSAEQVDEADQEMLDALPSSRPQPDPSPSVPLPEFDQ